MISNKCMTTANRIVQYQNFLKADPGKAKLFFEEQKHDSAFVSLVEFQKELADAWKAAVDQTVKHAQSI